MRDTAIHTYISEDNHTYRMAGRQPGWQADRHTYIICTHSGGSHTYRIQTARQPAHMHTSYLHSYIRARIQAEIDRRAGGQKGKQREQVYQTGRQTYIHTGSQSDRQAGRQAGIYTYKNYPHAGSHTYTKAAIHQHIQNHIRQTHADSQPAYRKQGWQPPIQAERQADVPRDRPKGRRPGMHTDIYKDNGKYRIHTESRIHGQTHMQTGRPPDCHADNMAAGSQTITQKHMQRTHKYGQAGILTSRQRGWQTY